MTINWDQIVATVLTTVSTGATILAPTAWLIKKLVVEGLNRETEKFKIKLKADVDTELERVKASLAKAGMLHSRQVEVLLELHRPLMKAEGIFQSLTGRARFKGQLPDEDSMKLLGEELSEAHRVYVNQFLLIPADIGITCSKFFATIQNGLIDFNFARDPLFPDGIQRAETWDKAADAAYKQLPPIRSAIEKAARDLIFGTSAASHR